MPLTDDESSEVQRLVDTTTSPAGTPVDAMTRGRLRAWAQRADGPDLDRLHVLLDGRADAPASDPTSDSSAAMTRGAVRAAALNRQEMNR